MRLFLLSLSLFVFVFSTSSLRAQERTYTSVSMVTIPDNGCPVYSMSTLNVPDAEVPNDGLYRLQKVGLTITHPRAEDLDIRLVAPNGTTVELSSDNGAGGANYQSTYFVFGGIIAENGPISSGVAPFFGNYLPEGNAEAGTALAFGRDPIVGDGGFHKRLQWLACTHGIPPFAVCT